MNLSSAFRIRMWCKFSCRWLLLLAMNLACWGQAPVADAPLAGSPASFQFPGKALLPGKGPISSWTGFPHHWAERRAGFWQSRERDMGGVVFLGDSITEGWKQLAGEFPDLKVVNRGIGGDVTRGVLYRLKEDVLDLHPQAVVLLIGINDLGNGGKPSEVAENTRMILTRLKALDEHMPIILCKVMPSKKDLAKDIQKLNSLLDEIVRTDARVIPCDTWSIYASEKGTCYRGEFPDMLHPNEVGYARWAAALKPLVAGLNLPAKESE